MTIIAAKQEQWRAWGTRVDSAIDRTARSMQEHWFSILARNTNGPERGDNYIDTSSPDEVEAQLNGANWHPYESVDNAFLSGIDYGVCKSHSLSRDDPDAVVTLAVDPHDKTLYATAPRADVDRTDFCVVHLANEPGIGEVVASICIGDIIPAATAMAGGPHGFRGGERVSVRAALAIGVTTLKYV